MSNSLDRALHRLGEQLPARLSFPGDRRYIAATALWAKPVHGRPQAVAHCRTCTDVQAVIRAARSCDLPLSVRGGGHDWAGRALCDGIVIDLSGMAGVEIGADERTARVSGGARAADVLAATDPLGLAAVTGSCGAVGMTGLTLGGGYGALSGRYGLAVDNLLAAEVVLADGSIVVANHDTEKELFWALRGGGGNFGVVTAMRLQLHALPEIRSGMLLYPFAEARSVLEACAAYTSSAPDELTAQLGIIVAPDGAPVVMVVPTWCGRPEEGEARLAPFHSFGTLLIGTIATMSVGARARIFDPHIVNGQRVFMETCWLPTLDGRSIDAFIAVMECAVSAGCAIFTHEFKGAASRVPAKATAFGLRRDHVLVEILATFDDRSDREEEERHRGWAAAVRRTLAPMALPGGYPNLLARDDVDRAARSYGANAERLMAAKRHYDPDNIFRSAIPLPVARQAAALVV